MRLERFLGLGLWLGFRFGLGLRLGCLGVSTYVAKSYLSCLLLSVNSCMKLLQILHYSASQLAISLVLFLLLYVWTVK